MSMKNGNFSIQNEMREKNILEIRKFSDWNERECQEEMGINRKFSKISVNFGGLTFPAVAFLGHRKFTIFEFLGQVFFSR